MKKILTLSFLLCVFLQTMAYEWTDGNGVSWTFTANGSEATITECSLHNGDVIIPSKVYFDEIEYTVTSIGRLVFEHSSLTSVSIPKSVTSIGYDAFYRCDYLSKVYIYDLTAWCIISFYNDASNPLINCGHLYLDDTEITNLVIPSGVKSISNYAFIGGTGLTSVTIPKSVKSIGESAFGWCTNLTKVIVQDIAAWCHISFGNSDANPLYYAKHLYNNANTEITDLVIPGGVTSINGYAFYNCSNLTSVNIPSSTTSIGAFAFYDCSSLTSVYCYIKTPLEITNNTFTNRDKATLYVPYGCKSAYQDAYCWKEFKEIVEMEDTGEPSGITTNIAAPDKGDIRVYGVNGQSRPALRPGVNIIRMSDGTTRKY